MNPLLGALVLQMAAPPITVQTVTSVDWSQWLMPPLAKSRPARNKNPGNLKARSLTIARRLYGAGNVVGLDEENHVQFASWEAGLAAVRQDVRVKVSGRSATKLPPNPTIENFSRVYAQDIHHGDKLAQMLGTTPRARIGIDVQEEAFLRALIRLEGGQDTWLAVVPLLEGRAV